jgi:hypothetical protein
MPSLNKAVLLGRGFRPSFFGNKSLFIQLVVVITASSVVANAYIEVITA